MATVRPSVPPEAAAVFAAPERAVGRDGERVRATGGVMRLLNGRVAIVLCMLAPGGLEAQVRPVSTTDGARRAALIGRYAEAAVTAVPDSLGMHAFYRKYVDALGIPIVSSEKVPDDALLVARDIVNSMLAGRPDLRAALIGRRWRVAIMAETEITGDIPEHANRKRPGAPPGEPVTQADIDYWARRARGLGGNPTSGAEENLLGYPGTRYYGEHILVHEFAHAIMGGGIRTADSLLYRAIQAAYDDARAQRKYHFADGRPHYAMTNANEYWAEGVQWWFWSNYGECFAGDRRVQTPDDLKAYDPMLFDLIGQVFRTHRIAMDVFHARNIPPRSTVERGELLDCRSPGRS
jgi:hypothetical protein